MAKKKLIKQIPNIYFIEIENAEDWELISDWLYGTIDYTFVKYWILKVPLTNKQYNWFLGKLEANKLLFTSGVSIYCRLEIKGKPRTEA